MGEDRQDKGASHDDSALSETRTHPGGGEASRDSPETGAPEWVGAYRVVSRLGEGGMGAVFEAEQDSPRRIVALKLIRPGTATSSALRRFAHEAQVLGRLQHAGIAQIYEAGTAEVRGTSQPFFAMELVRGRTLDEYVRGERSTVPERLELLARICDAVQYAHQQGVIHRDLKPGNILVDDEGNPKVLDFGLARLTDNDLQLTTMGTEVGALVGTVSYMSPEQATGDPDEIDTRTDVYSLGVIGYELLAERLPYDMKGKMLHQALGAIREQDPSRLSTIDRRFRGDLEIIFARALEKDKERRYASAAELAADIRRHLGDEPILARPPSTVYQLRKFARRHKSLVAGIGAGFAALVLGLIGTTYGLVQANVARETAEREAQKAAAINEFLLQEMLAAPAPGIDGRDVTVASVLDRASGQVGGSFAAQPDIEAAVRSTLGNTYKKLGLHDRALEHLDRALVLQRELHGEDSLEALGALHDLGGWQLERDDYTAAHDSVSRVLAGRRRLLGEEHPDTLEARATLASVLFRQGEYEQAAEMLRDVLEIRRRTLGDEHPTTLQNVAGLGWVLERGGDLEETQALFAEAAAGFAKLHGEDHPQTISALNGLGGVYLSLWKPEETEQTYRKTLAASRRVFGDDHPETAIPLNGLANVLNQLGRHDEAIPLYREMREIYVRRLGDDHQFTMVAVNNLANALARSGEHAEGKRLHRENLERRRRVLGEDHPAVGQSLDGMANAHRTAGDFEAAASYYRQALNVYGRVHDNRHPDLQAALSNLALSEWDAGNPAGAEQALRELLPIEREVMGASHVYVLSDLGLLVLAVLKQGRADEAETLARELLELRQQNPNQPASELDLTRSLIGECLMEQGRHDEAERLLVESLGALEGYDPPVSDEKLAVARERLYALYRRTGRLELIE